MEKRKGLDERMQSFYFKIRGADGKTEVITNVKEDRKNKSDKK